MRRGGSALSILVAAAFARCSTPAPHTPRLSRLQALQVLADSGHELPRPILPPKSDTNSASAYYNLGVSFGVAPDTAEMALYWASRLDPSSAEPLYEIGRASCRERV